MTGSVVVRSIVELCLLHPAMKSFQYWRTDFPPVLGSPQPPSIPYAISLTKSSKVSKSYGSAPGWSCAYLFDECQLLSERARAQGPYLPQRPCAVFLGRSRCFFTAVPLTIAFLKAFSRARWKKSSRDIFFGIGDGERSNLNVVKSVGRIKREGKEETHLIKECSCLAKTKKAYCETRGKTMGAW